MVSVNSKIAWRAVIHLISGGVLVVTMGLSYYSITAFVDDSSQADAPASLLAWCMFTPTWLIMGWLANQHMLTDSILPSPFKIFFLLLELAIALAVIIVTSRNPVFECGITSCTYDNMPAPKYEDEVNSSWHAQSAEGALSLFYFFLAIVFLPWLMYLLWVQMRVLLKYKTTSIVTKKRALQEFKEKYPDAHTFGGVDDNEHLTRESTIEMMDNPMLEEDRSRISVIKNHHKALHKKNIKSFEEVNKQQWDLIEREAVDEHERKSQQKEYVTYACAFLTLIVLFPINLFATSRFGNDFQWYSNYGIAAWAKHQIEPAIPQITINDDLNYKFFPQIIIFYVFLYSVVAAGLVSRFVPKIKQIMDSRPKLLKSVDATVGEALFSFYIVLFTWITFCYVFFNWYADPHVKWLGSAVSERWGRCLGQTALFPMGVMILPVSRNSVWSSVLNYPGEQMLKFHKWAAGMFLVLSFGHLFAFMGVFASLGELPAAMIVSPNTYRSQDSTIGMMSGVVVFIVIPVFCVGTMNIIRRRYFEVFYFTHFASGILFLAIIWHSDFAWMYLVPGLTLYLVDMMIRFNKQTLPIRVMGLKALEDDITEITFAVLSNPGYRRSTRLKGGPAQKGDLKFAPEGIHFEMGQYVYLTLPGLSNVQSHPFNISSSVYDRYTTCYIKSQGEGTYTGQLYEFVKNMENPETKELPLKYIPIHIDGPYGLPFDYAAYSSLLFVAGGIGITPLHCIIRSLLQLLKTGKGLAGTKLKKVRLVWTFKNPDMLFDNSTIEETLKMIPPTPSYFKALAKKQLDKGKRQGKGLKGGIVSKKKEKEGDDDDMRVSWSAERSKVMVDGDGKAQGNEETLKTILAQSKDEEALSNLSNAFDMSQYPSIDGDIVFEVSLHCTSGAKGPGPATAAKRADAGIVSVWHPIIPERSDIREEVRGLMGNPGALVYCVGPPTLIKTATDACSDYNVTFRGETAEF